MREADALEDAISRRLTSLGSPTTESIRAVRREFSKELASQPAGSVFALALQLLDRERVVPRFFVYELVYNHREASGRLNGGKLKLLGKGLDSWGAVDAFAYYLSGPAWRRRQVPDSLIAAWAVSKDRWWRRAAVVSTVPLNSRAQGGSGDVDRTLQICKLVVNDRDDMVVKALSWALRELTKRDRQAVKAFLDKYQAELPARVLREVRNKLATGVKNPRMKRSRR